MASLKKNIQIIHESIAKNVGIVTAQAREKARTAAYDYMQHRTDQDMRIIKDKDFEDYNAVIAWLEKLEEVNNSMPELREEDESEELVASGEPGNGRENH